MDCCLIPDYIEDGIYGGDFRLLGLHHYGNRVFDQRISRMDHQHHRDAHYGGEDSRYRVIR